MGSYYLNKRTLSGGTVELTVGESEIPFDAHIELLCDRSSWFDRELEDRFVNSSARELNFPNEDPEVFADFISWAYCGEISSGVEASSDSGSSQILHLFRLWTLAEKFQVSELQDLAMTYCELFLDFNRDKLVGYDAVNHAYLHGGTGSALCQLAVDIWVERATKSEFLQAQTHFPRQFLEDFSLAWLDKKEAARLDSVPNNPSDGKNPSSGKFLNPVRLDAVSDRPPRATEAQMANRKIKSPSPSFRRHTSEGKASPSPSPAASESSPRRPGVEFPAFAPPKGSFSMSPLFQEINKAVQPEGGSKLENKGN